MGYWIGGRGGCITKQSSNGNEVKWKKGASAQRVLIHTANYFGTDLDIRVRNGMNLKVQLKLEKKQERTIQHPLQSM